MRKRVSIPEPVQLPSGSWRIQIRQKGRSISITDPDPQVVVAKALSIKAGLIKPKRKAADMTLRQACRAYIDERRSRRSPSTIDGYEKITRCYFQDIMDVALKRLTRRKLDDAVGDECERTSRRGGSLSPKTIINAWRFVSSVLEEFAPDLDRRVTLPEKKAPVAVLTPAEEIIPAIIGTDVELPCLLAAWLSLTMSEILGLTKSKSIRGDYLMVVETVVHTRLGDIRKAGGKEEQRSRALRLPPYIRHLIDQVDGDVIVPRTAASITARYRRILRDAGVDYMSFHKLRHLNASTMAYLGVDRATAKARGGWKTSAIMDDVYTHSLKRAAEVADQMIGDYFLGIIDGREEKPDESNIVVLAKKEGLA